MQLSSIAQYLNTLLKLRFSDAAAAQPQTRGLCPKEMATLMEMLYTAKDMTQTSLIAVDSLLAATPLEDDPESIALCAALKGLDGENRDRMIVSIQEYTLNAAALAGIRQKTFNLMMNGAGNNNPDAPLGAVESGLISSVVEGDRTARNTYNRVAHLAREMVGKVNIPHVNSLMATLDELDDKIKVRAPIPPFFASVSTPPPGP